MEITKGDLVKYPHLRKALGLPDAPTYSADDEIIPRELLNYEATPPPSIVIVKHGSDRIFITAIAIALAILLVPVGIVVAMLATSAGPTLLIGGIIGALATYGLSARRDHANEE